MKYGRYDIVEEWGKGAMGVIYRAHDPQIDRIIALKVLRHDRVISEEYVQRFIKEAKAIGRLSHPNIVTVYDVGQDQGTIYFAMEFLEGTPLDGVIQEKRLSPEEIVNFGVQVAEALDYAHQQGIVHRDIKPGNIILTSTGQAKITDFGIARIEDPSAPQQTQAGEILGTPSYIPPELLMSQPVDGRSDLYSLGVILYELTTGRRPFSGNSMEATFKAIIEDRPVEPRKTDPSISEEVSKLIMKSLNRKPDERFQTGKEMADALRGLTKKEDGKTAPSVVPKKPLFKKKGQWLLLFFVSILVVVAAILYYFYPRAAIMLESEPEGAEIYVEEVLKGKTPLLLELKQGAYRIRIIKKSYQKWEKEIFLKRGRNEPVGVKLTKSKPGGPTIIRALLNVDSVPNGAKVFLNNSLKGETPFKLKLPVGKHEVRLSLHDHHDWEAPVQLDKEGIPLVVRLLPLDERND
jgi:serine/threonine-protein kinase